ncbi:MAG: DUF3450 family protein [Planctomycetota bacterium]|nr:MAG: DUF3450 family protein [Planctomycetota bacterium]
MKTLLWLSALLAVAALAPAQESPKTGDAARLEEAVRTLQRERRDYYRRLDERERDLQEERRKLSVLERERRERSERRKALEDELGVAKGENARANAELEKSRALDGRLSEAASRIAAATTAQIRAGLPYDLDRRTSRVAAEGGALDRLEALRTTIREELEESREGSLRSEEVVLPDGRRKPSRVGRVGHQFLFFVTEDGLEGGVRIRSGDSWTWQMAQGDALRDLKKAVRILARQDAPGRAPLPFEPGKESR